LQNILDVSPPARVLGQPAPLINGPGAEEQYSVPMSSEDFVADDQRSINHGCLPCDCVFIRFG
jgi:hypothetical protein